MPDYEARIQMLEIENMALRDRVAELEDAIGLANVDTYGLYFDLTVQEAICFGVLLKNKAPQRSAFMSALYSGKVDDAPDLKIVDVFICKLRKKIKALGIDIDTSWGEGFSMPDASKARARELMEK